MREKNRKYWKERFKKLRKSHRNLYDVYMDELTRTSRLEHALAKLHQRICRIENKRDMDVKLKYGDLIMQALKQGWEYTPVATDSLNILSRYADPKDKERLLTAFELVEEMRTNSDES